MLVINIKFNDCVFFFFSSRRRHTRFDCDWSSDVCSSDLLETFEQNARALFEKGPSRVSPFFVPMYMPNVAAALISMRYGAKGPNYCTVSACASSAHSVGDALELIRHDQADIMIAGGAEAAITPLAVASFANMKA